MKHLPETPEVFNADSERKTKRNLKRVLIADLWNNRYVRLVLSAYWNSLDSPVNFFKTIKHFVKRNYLDLGSFPIHKAVFERDLISLSKLCSGDDRTMLYIDFEKPDPHGNTPLMLAIKLDYQDEASVLLDFGADPKFSPDASEPSPFEQVIALKNKSLLSRMVAAANRLKLQVWELHREVTFT